MEPRTIARVIAAGRVAAGGALVLAPRLLASGWVGRDARRPAVKVFAAGLGARDLALAAGVLSSLSSGNARPWIAASAAADLGDLVATLRAREDLPTLGVVGVGAIAGGAAAVGAWLAAQEDW